ncbi:Rossmann-like domain-containing protein [Clostridium thailandense]|uniref:Rossmann-like domain-containing protein n=1 Tax=Clostridium thailandense TaxID=2794346 RepID=UPI0039895D02
MWQIYDDLINEIPEELTVLECMVGASWTLVRSEQGLGIVKTIKGGKQGSELSNISGMQLKKLAEYSKSWNMLEASLGMAAINSAFNNSSQIMDINGEIMLESDNPEKYNAFKVLEPKMKGKKVAVIGHFPKIEKLKEICELSILERDPQQGDYPDPACEYLLPEQDFVFITGTAFTNKTMPRLIQLSRKAQIILVGPSVPVSKILFKYGVKLIGSFVVIEQQLIWKAVQEGKKMNIFKSGGKMVCIHLCSQALRNEK